MVASRGGDHTHRKWLWRDFAAPEGKSLQDGARALAVVVSQNSGSTGRGLLPCGWRAALLCWASLRGSGRARVWRLGGRQGRGSAGPVAAGEPCGLKLMGFGFVGSGETRSACTGAHGTLEYAIVVEDPDAGNGKARKVQKSGPLCLVLGLLKHVRRRSR